MKIKWKKPNKNDSIFKDGFTVSPIKNYLKSKEDRGLKPLFFEKIGDKNTSRDKMLKNLIKQLEANGFKIKNKKK